MHRLLQEIREQPRILRTLLSDGLDEVRSIVAEIKERSFDYALIAARGTSDNAAIYAKYLFGSRNHLPVALAAPSLHTIYQTPPSLRSGLVIGISQSGRSPDIVSVVADARHQGAPTLAITNTPDSPLAQAAEWSLYCHAGEERSVAATKTFTAQLLVLALLSTALSEDERGLSELSQIPSIVEETLGLDEYISRAAERYRYMNGCAVIGRGYNYATSFEVALKLKELNYITATPYSSTDFLHGPIAVVGRGFPVLTIAPRGAVLPNMLDLLAELGQRHAELIVVSDSPEALAHAQTPICLPCSMAEWVSPIAAVIPGQLLAYHLALVKGLDPEHPRGLQKVTETL